MSLLNYAHPEVLVDTQWVSEHLSDQSASCRNGPGYHSL